MQHAHLDFGHGIAHEPIVASPHLVQSLAREAVKHIPGALDVVNKHFTEKSNYRDILPKKAINQLMYPPHP